MSKMGEEFTRETERKFGDILPNADAICTDCGECYRDHFGLECPPKEPEDSALEKIKSALEGG